MRGSRMMLYTRQVTHAVNNHEQLPVGGKGCKEQNGAAIENIKKKKIPSTFLQRETPLELVTHQRRRQLSRAASVASSPPSRRAVPDVRASQRSAPLHFSADPHDD